MKRGFTLLETIFASVLFAFIILFVLNLYPGSMVAIHRGETQIVADNFAQSILEDLRSRSFGNVSVVTPPAYTKKIYANTEFEPFVSVAYHPDSVAEPQLEGYLKVASVKIRWKFQRRDNEVVHIMYLHNVTR